MNQTQEEEEWMDAQDDMEYEYPFENIYTEMREVEVFLNQINENYGIKHDQRDANKSALAIVCVQLLAFDADRIPPEDIFSVYDGIVNTLINSDHARVVYNRQERLQGPDAATWSRLKKLMREPKKEINYDNLHGASILRYIAYAFGITETEYSNEYPRETLAVQIALDSMPDTLKEYVITTLYNSINM